MVVDLMVYTASGEMLGEKKELAKQVVPVYSDLLRLLNEHEVSCRELVLYITGSLATIAQNLGVESFNDRIVCSASLSSARIND